MYWSGSQTPHILMPPAKKPVAKPAAKAAGVKAAAKGGAFSLDAYIASSGTEGRITAFGVTLKGNLKVSMGDVTGHMYRKTLEKGLEDESLTTEGDDIICAKGFRPQDGIFWPKSDFDSTNV